MNGRTLNFRFAGINNQNFIMQDEETGSWWQQVNGEAILGPLKGHRLKVVFHDELSFAIWKHEQPQGRVLRPDDKTAWKDFSANLEDRVAKMPVFTQTSVDDILAPRTVVVGITVNSASKAYPFSAIQRQSPVLDTIGGMPIIVVLGDDKKSVRAFKSSIDGRKLEFFAKADDLPLRLIDAETGSEWDFTGKAVNGPLVGRQLEKIYVLKDYWFDWKAYNPGTAIYTLGWR